MKRLHTVVACIACIPLAVACADSATPLGGGDASDRAPGASPDATASSPEAPAADTWSQGPDSWSSTTTTTTTPPTDDPAPDPEPEPQPDPEIDPDPEPDPEPDPPVSVQNCHYTSTTFATGMFELDVQPGQDGALEFTVPSIPDPSLIESATLHFDSFDADHPGTEGFIDVNGLARFDIPANAAWDNQPGTGAVDVRDALVAGSNQLVFLPNPQQRSFFRIGRVAIEASAAVSECAPPPPPERVTRQVHYLDATYGSRHNWVIRCNDYAFTARGDEHHATDCDGGYAPDSARTGTATFRFADVAAGPYRVEIDARHTENRNPAGALFIVDGVEQRISQRSSAGYTTDVWGEIELSGDVDVVLDSTREGESDSVIAVRLVPL